MHVIKKNVPIPRTIRAPLPARRKYPFDEMDVGDMFFVPNRPKNTLATHASTVGKQLGRRFITRLTHMVMTDEGWEPCEPGTEGAVQGIGVWRAEDKTPAEQPTNDAPAAPAVAEKPKKAAKKKASKKKAEPEPEPEPTAEPELDEGWDDVAA